MIRTLLAPSRLVSLAVAVVFAVVAVVLGSWQFSRHQDRLADRALVERGYDAAPVPLDQVLSGPEAPWSPRLEWTSVEVTGSYAAPEQLLVRNRTYRQVAGYAVTVPLVVGDGGREDPALLVDRGWVRNARDAATAPDVPPVPGGEVTVTGWLRPSESDLGRDLPEGQLASINLARAEERTGRELYDAYLVLDTESLPGGGDPPERPVAADRPDTGLGSHLAYALQWWLTAPVGIVLVLVMARRDAREGRDAGAARAAGGRPRQPAPASRRRIWDEEDE